MTMMLTRYAKDGYVGELARADLPETHSPKTMHSSESASKLVVTKEAYIMDQA